MYKYYRCFICLLLVAVLAFNISPVKAQASSLAVGAAVGVAATVAVAVGLQALGVRAGADSSAFNKLVDDCSAAISPQWAVNGLVTMLTLTQDGMPKTYLSQGFLQSILDWLYDNDIVIEGAPFVPAGTPITLITGDTIVTEQNCYVIEYVYQSHDNSGHHKNLVISETNKNLTYYLNGSTDLLQGGHQQADLGAYRVATFSIYYSDVRNIRPDLPRLTYSEYTYYDTKAAIRLLEQGYFNGFASSFDLNLESIGQNLDSDYVAYMNSGVNSADAGISFTDDPSTDRDESEDNNQPWLPAAIPSLNTGEYADQTQADAQSGLTAGSIIDELISSKPGVDAEPGSILDWLSKIWDTIIGLPAAIAQAIAQVLADIFVPSSDFVTAKVESIQARFDWITPIIDFAKSFQGAISGSEPPIIYVHLQNYEGPYNFGGTVKFLDMTWYSRYKSQGDAIISGFLWALLGWRLFMKLPGIINGAAGDIGQMSYGESMWQQAQARKERKERGVKQK